jgi:hypothetical protein
MAVTSQEANVQSYINGTAYLIRNSDGVVLPTFRSKSFELDPGIKQDFIMATNANGAMVPTVPLIKERMAKMKITFGAGQANLLIQELIHAGRFVLDSAAAPVIAEQITVLANTVPAATAGNIFFGLAADTAVAYMINLVTGLPQLLTRVAASTLLATVQAATLTYSQGADGVFQFSNDLLGRVVTFRATKTAFSTPTLKDILPGSYTLIASGIKTSDNSIDIIKAVLAYPDFTAAMVPGADSVDVTFVLVPPAGACIGYEFVALRDQAYKCQ